MPSQPGSALTPRSGGCRVLAGGRGVEEGSTRTAQPLPSSAEAASSQAVSLLAEQTDGTKQTLLRTPSSSDRSRPACSMPTGWLGEALG